jgi:hypothetical protein
VEPQGRGTEEPLYRRVVKRLSAAAGALSLDGVVLACNDRLAALLQQPADAIEGKPFAQYLAADYADGFRECLLDPGLASLNVVFRSEVSPPCTPDCSSAA